MSIGCNTFAQKNKFQIELNSISTEENIIYRDSYNTIQIIPPQEGDSRFELKVKNSDSDINDPLAIKRDNKGGYLPKDTYRIVAWNEPIIDVILYSYDKTKILEKFEIEVRDLPSPIVYFGDCQSGETCSGEATAVSVQFPETIKPDNYFEVTSFTINANGDELKNENDETLTDEMRSFVSKLSPGTELSISVTAKYFYTEEVQTIEGLFTIE